MNTTMPTIEFEEEESKSAFLRTLNVMSGETFEENRDAMLPHMTQELVDGQHILHACNVLTTSDFQAGHLSREDYDAIFVKKPATIIAHNDVVCYGTQSLKLNDYTTTQLYHTTMIQTLTKAQKAWLRFKCPFKINKSIDDTERKPSPN